MMKRGSLVLSVFATVCLCPSFGWAGNGDKDAAKAEAQPAAEETFTPEEAETATPEATSDPEEPAEGTKKKSAKDAKLGEERVSWQDIVVVIRKPFLKMNRVEVVPSWGISVNDNMIQHHMFDGEINYYLTDVLAVGVEGQYFYQHRFLETFDLVASQDRRSPTLNKYNWGAALNFHYAPIYGKFAILNRRLVHWETIFTAGLGVTQTEVIPRNPDPVHYPSWTNTLLTPNLGLTMRVFLTKWITLSLGVRDYIFVDKYEPVNRMAEDSLAKAMSDADPSLVNHIMFQTGLSFWFPTSFQYTTFR